MTKQEQRLQELYRLRQMSIFRYNQIRSELNKLEMEVKESLYEIQYFDEEITLTYHAIEQSNEN